MARFRKKPVVVEAEQIGTLLLGSVRGGPIPAWVLDAVKNGTLYLGAKHVEVITLEGKMTGAWDDWLIQGVSGELYPCRDDIFRKTYDRAEFEDAA